MKFLVIRNAEYIGEKEGFGAGPQTGLTEIGRTQAALLADRLANESPCAIYASMALRAVDTISSFAKRVGISIVQRREFDSFDIGDCAGLKTSEIAAKLGPEAWKEIMTAPNPLRRYFLDGETLEEQSKRVQRGLETCIASHTVGDTIIISTHFTVIASIMSSVVASPLANLWLWGGSAGAVNTSISTISIENNRYRIVSFNSTDHLLSL